MAEQEHDQEFIEYIVKNIVNHPEDVRTDRKVDERGVLITLHVNPDDMGYVIGRQGQTARALRTLLKIVGAKNNARINLKIHEPEDGERGGSGGNDDSDEEDESDEDVNAGETTSVEDLGI